jgi:hypothetical protein
MTHGLQQQDPAQGFRLPRWEPMPQHGQKADKSKAQPARQPRSFEPRPGH